MIPQREGARYGPGARAHHTFSALERLHVCGTGHSRLSLLCRVLAEGESAPSARKCTNALEARSMALLRLRRRSLSPGPVSRAEGRRERWCLVPARREHHGDACSRLRAARQRGRSASQRHSNHVKGKNGTSMKNASLGGEENPARAPEAPPAPSPSQNLIPVPVLAVRPARAPPI